MLSNGQIREYWQKKLVLQHDSDIEKAYIFINNKMQCIANLSQIYDLNGKERSDCPNTVGYTNECVLPEELLDIIFINYIWPINTATSRNN